MSPVAGAGGMRVLLDSRGPPPVPDPRPPGEMNGASPFSYSRCLELMLSLVSHHGPRCHLMVASHNEESVHQATKRYEVGGWGTGPPSFFPSAHMPEMGRGQWMNKRGYSALERILNIFNPYHARRSCEPWMDKELSLIFWGVGKSDGSRK